MMNSFPTFSQDWCSDPFIRQKGPVGYHISMPRLLDRFATLKVLEKMSDPAELPEYLAHPDPVVVAGALVKLEELRRPKNGC